MRMVRQIPNLLTGLRFLLVPVMVWLLLKGQFWLALGVFMVMGLSDGLDGFLAKRFGWTTKLGEFMDPLADKTMLVSAYITLGWLGLIPKWLVIVVIARDVIILAGAAAYHFVIHHLQMDPSLISKINTLVQILLVLGEIVAKLELLPTDILKYLMALTLFTTVISGVSYIVEWSARAKREFHRGFD